MAKSKNNADIMQKVAQRPSRPSLSRMQDVKARAMASHSKSKTSKARKSAKSSTPKVLSRKSGKKASASLAKGPSVKRPLATAKMPAKRTGTPQAAKPRRHRSAKGSAPRINIAGRHVPTADRYKTGHWRPVRQPWMTDGVWRAVLAMNRFREKGMARDLGNASKGQRIYGKQGPGHAGYGTGELQKYADRMVRQGVDPHLIDLTKWFSGAVNAYNFHNGKEDFNKKWKDHLKDEDHMLHAVIQEMQRYIPELKKLSKRDLKEAIKHNFHTIQYGPDGRTK